MSVVTFGNNAQITARSAFQVSQAIAYTTVTAAVIARDNAIAAWQGTASHRRIAGIIARASYAGIRAASPHVRTACIQLIAVIIALAVLAYRRGAQFRGWLDALVAECQQVSQSPAVPEPEIEPEPSPEPEPVATPPAPPAPQPAPQPAPPAPMDLAALPATKLRRMARDAGMPGASRATKAAAIAWLTA